MKQNFTGLFMTVFLFIGMIFIVFKSYNLFISIAHNGGLQNEVLQLLAGALILSGLFTFKITLIKRKTNVLEKEIKALSKIHILSEEEVHDEALNQIDEEEENKRQLEELRNQETQNKFNSIRSALNELEKNNIENIFKLVCSNLEAVQGVYYAVSQSEYKIEVSYAKVLETNDKTAFNKEEGFVGEAIKENRVIVLRNIPYEFLKVYSGLGQAKPATIAYVPIEHQSEVVHVMEIAFFKPIDKAEEQLLKNIAECISEITHSSIIEENEVEDQNNELTKAQTEN